jgi:hypothetical protein
MFLGRNSFDQLANSSDERDTLHYVCLGKASGKKSSSEGFVGKRAMFAGVKKFKISRDAVLSDTERICAIFATVKSGIMSKKTRRNLNSHLKYAMRTSHVAVATLVLSVLGSGTLSQAQVSEIICDGRWQTIPAVDVTRQLGDFNSLNAVAALSSTDVWAVGQWARFAGTDYNHTLAEHWDGTSWTEVLTPHPQLPISYLFGVAAIASNDVWAVGYEINVGGNYRTLIEHWDGTAWTVVQDGTFAGWLTSVAAIAPDDVWAVGSTNYIGQGLIEHWDGTTWTRTLLQDTVFLRAVTAINQSDVWAVGQLPHDSEGDYTYAVHFDGSSWTQVPTPSPLQRQPAIRTG